MSGTTFRSCLKQVHEVVREDKLSYDTPSILIAAAILYHAERTANVSEPIIRCGECGGPCTTGRCDAECQKEADRD